MSVERDGNRKRGQTLEPQQQANAAGGKSDSVARKHKC